jgi:hypothetical protein
MFMRGGTLRREDPGVKRGAAGWRSGVACRFSRKLRMLAGTGAIDVQPDSGKVWTILRRLSNVTNAWTPHRRAVSTVFS